MAKTAPRPRCGPSGGPGCRTPAFRQAVDRAGNAHDNPAAGYSSLSYLKRFKLDGIKIDREFIDGLGTDDNDSAIVEAIIGMARGLSMDVVAEGVETEVQLARLRP